jgi:hypothetical protein
MIHENMSGGHLLYPALGFSQIFLRPEKALMKEKEMALILFTHFTCRASFLLSFFLFFLFSLFSE